MGIGRTTPDSEPGNITPLTSREDRHGVAAIINAVGQSPCHDPNGNSYWKDTAIFVIWDDWGGIYDHVQPYEVLVNQPNTWGSGYVSGFRVPMLVVSAYTPAHYVSGSWSGQGSPPTTCPIAITPQYCHDFGSILAFIENNFFGLTGIGTINPQYQSADGHAPDSAGGNIPLSDFFPPGSPQQFRPISIPAGAPDASYFINYMGTPQDPDNDANDTD